MDLGSLLGRLVARARDSGGAGGGLAAGAGMPLAQLSAGPGPASTGAWRHVTALRPTVADAPLVAPTPPFRAGLAAARPAPIALAALGHGRGLEAPSGLASGVAVPVARTPSEPIPSSVRRGPVQRRAGDEIEGAWPEAWANADRSEPAPSSEASPAAPTTWRAGSPGGARPAAPLISAPPVAPPAGRLGSVAPAVARRTAPDAPAGGHELVAAAADSLAADSPAAGRAAAEVPGAAPASRSGPIDGTLAADAAPAGAHEASADRGATGSSPALAVPAGLAPIASAPARRLRLGPPLASTMVARRADADVPRDGSDAPAPRPSPSPAVMPTGHPGGASAQRAAEGAASHASMAEGSGGSGATGPLQALGVDTPGPSGSPEAGRTVGAPLAAAATRPQRGDVVWQGGIDAVAASPLVGSLRPTLDAAPPAVAVRRSADVEPAEPEAATGTPTAALAALAQADPSAALAGAWGSGGAWSGALSPIPSTPHPGAGPSGATDGAPFTVARTTDDGTAAAPRLTWTNPWFPADTGAPTAAPPGTRTAAPRSTPTQPAAIRAAGAGARPLPPGGAGVPVSRLATSEDARRQLPAGFAPRPAVLRVGPAVPTSAAPSATSGWAAEAAGGPAASTGTTTPDPRPLVARAADSASDGPTIPLAPLQRADVSSEPLAGAETPAAAPGAAGAPAGAGGPTQDKELDELARRLYDRIGGRLRRDLLVERERAGTLVDRGF